MELRALRYFVEVVRQQSFTAAAEQMFVTQPTISKMVKSLEDEIGSPLLLRDGRQMVLTDAGASSISAVRTCSPRTRSCRPS